MQNFWSALCIAMISTCWTGTAFSQSMGLSLRADGRLGAGLTDQQGAAFHLFGDATARLSRNGTPLAFELGLYGLASTDDTPHETYGTFTWDFAQGGRLFLGVPRPAYDSFAVSAVDTLFPSQGVLRTGLTRSLATYGAMYEGFLPYGVRFENETNRLRYAVSVATVPNRDATIAGFGLGIPLGNLTLEAAVEASSAGKSTVAGKIQVSGVVDHVKAGIGVYMPGTVGGQDMMEAFASFAPGQHMTISGIVQVPLGSSNDMTAGIAARYDFPKGIGVSVGAFSDAGAAPVYSTVLDWTF